jgi:hypothetical protein
LSNRVSIGAGHAAVHANERDGAAAADDVDGGVQGVEAVDAGFCIIGLATASGRSPVSDFLNGRTVRLHPDSVDYRVGATACGHVADDVPEIVAVLVEIDRVHAASLGSAPAPCRRQ